MARKHRENAAVPRWNEERQRWQLQIQKDGKRKQFSSAKPGKAGSDECTRKYNRWLAGGKVLTDPRLREVWPEYLQDIEQRRGKNSKTYINAEQIGRINILPAIGHRKLSQITEQHLQDLLNNAKRVSGKGMLSRKTIMNIRGEISLLWKYLRKAGYVYWKPLDLEISQKFEPKGDKDVFQKEHVAFLLQDQTMDPYVIAWQMILLYGFRPGEVYGLRWSDIDKEKISIRQSINATGDITEGKNKNAQRVEYVTSQARKILDRAEAYRDTCRVRSEYVFQREDGRPLCPSLSYKRMQTYCKTHNLPRISPYRLRHTFASIAKSVLTEQQMKLVLGHSPTMDTGIYVHRLTDDHLKTGQLLEELYSEMLN